jgi:hypothetical protein
MTAIWNGIGFAIGLVIGLLAIFYIARWLRYRWYLTPWADPEKMPFDVRQKILRGGVAGFRRRRPRMSPEERKEAAVRLLSIFGTDTPMDSETQNELVSEAMQMLSHKN